MWALSRFVHYASHDYAWSIGLNDGSMYASTDGARDRRLVRARWRVRPDLFAAAVPQVGGLDRLHFRDITVGKSLACDYSSVDNGDEFKTLHVYSHYQNVKYFRRITSNSLRPCSTRISRSS